MSNNNVRQNLEKRRKHARKKSGNPNNLKKRNIKYQLSSNDIGKPYEHTYINSTFSA